MQAIPGAAAAAGELHLLNPQMAAFAAAAGAAQQQHQAQLMEEQPEEPPLVLPAPHADGVAAGIIAAHEAAAAAAAAQTDAANLGVPAMPAASAGNAPVPASGTAGTAQGDPRGGATAGPVDASAPPASAAVQPQLVPARSLTVRLLQRWTTAELEQFLLSMWEEMLQVLTLSCSHRCILHNAARVLCVSCPSSRNADTC